MGVHAASVLLKRLPKYVLLVKLCQLFGSVDVSLQFTIIAQIDRHRAPPSEEATDAVAQRANPG
jgi:hypothetical protein